VNRKKFSAATPAAGSIDKKIGKQLACGLRQVRVSI
jgi:hypothetical protein